LSSAKGGGIVRILSVLVFEDFLLDEISIVLRDRGPIGVCVILEVEVVRVELALRS